MRAQSGETTPARSSQVARYAVNGLAATAVHFCVLSILLEYMGLQSAGVANAGAALAGVTVSFVGSRFFVFRAAHEPWLRQAVRFGALYGAIAALHGAVLFLWSDIGRYDYRLGFAIATGIQVALSYWGNKRLVFR